MEISCKIDTSGLQAGLAYASQYTKRSLTEMVNTSAYWIAVNAKANMPFVSPEKIDSELGTIVAVKIGARGKPLSTKAAKNKMYLGEKMGTKKTEVPLAALIVMARAKPDSRYNIGGDGYRGTNSRYALANNPFKGVSRAAGAQAMRALVDRMIKARHSSSKFLLVGWIPAIQWLRHFTDKKFMKGGAPPLEGAGSYRSSAELGSAKQASDGKFDCFAVIENNIGYEGQNKASFNAALIQYGLPGLQSAVDREGIENAKYALRRYDEELCREVNKFWK